MIHGLFGNDDELVFEIELIGADGLELPVDVILDTGFSGWLAIDEQDLQGLDWIYVQTRALRTARGEADFNIYAGLVRIDGQTFDIPVHVGEGVSEVLLGRQWLKTRRLVVDMPSLVLTLG
ncbi:aspartyl protease [Nostoc sphaeroides CHAB 2801]|uniref:aspartyl protease n=1 Tax=Nostoc sphaeroides TaxID=446679 RepID=UPI000E51D879|nr:aspartyl protease [Nostoc sphaeroides]MCC5634057.1 aspartyl protease [Nostoc sphaeroides CHAB 2801]